MDALSRPLSTTPEIAKENMGSLHFPELEVLQSEAGRQERSEALRRATHLGNLEKQKVRIYFEDMSGIKVVHTTIWAFTERKIILKAGLSIPICRVHSVELV